jgi:nitrogen regulatory protein P-II 1
MYGKYRVEVPYRMKKLEIIIPHRRLEVVSEILKNANTGGMSQYKVGGRGKVKAQEVAVGRGTMKYTPEYVPRTKVEVIIKDDQLDSLINKLVERFSGDSLGGKLFVTNVPVAVDLSTNKRDESAI